MFAAEGRLIRVAGNHDYDLQRTDLLEVMREKVPNMERPCDYLLLVGSRPQAVEYAILHGHQFDGAAGRFQNLIWGLEIVGGVATLVSWSYAGGPGKVGSSVDRRVWGLLPSTRAGAPPLLQASKSPTPIP